MLDRSRWADATTSAPQYALITSATAAAAAATPLRRSATSALSSQLLPPRLGIDPALLKLVSNSPDEAPDAASTTVAAEEVCHGRAVKTRCGRTGAGQNAENTDAYVHRGDQINSVHPGWSRGRGGEGRDSCFNLSSWRACVIFITRTSCSLCLVHVASRPAGLPSPPCRLDGQSLRRPCH